MDPESPLSYGLAILMGVALHLNVFRFGEWHTRVPEILSTAAAVLTALTLCLMVLSQPSKSLWPAFLNASSLSLYAILGIYASLIFYRLLFHPLRRFPGPIFGRLSSLYMQYQWFKRDYPFRLLHTWHKANRYGEIVRLGPCELSIANADAFRAIYTKCAKGPPYDILHPSPSLHNTRDKADHDRRRKAWDKAFTSQALRSYEPHVTHYTSRLVSRIEESLHREPINMAKSFHMCQFELMSELAFGHGLDAMNPGTLPRALQLMHIMTYAAGGLNRAVWLLLLFKRVPGLNRHFLEFDRWLSAEVTQRRLCESPTADLFSCLLEDMELVDNELTNAEFERLKSDVFLVLASGSETTSLALTCLFFELAVNPSVCKTLQQEIDQLHTQVRQPNQMDLAKLPYLQACINEALRLYPAIPSGMIRVTPAEGLQLKDTFIPGNILVHIPFYSLYRDERYFTDPDRFIPERFTSKPELIHDGAAFHPFLIGRYSCVGRQFGLLVMRHTISEILRRYNFSLAPGYRRQDFLDGLTEGFTMASESLNLVFTERTSSS